MITTHECRNEVTRMAKFPTVTLFLYIFLFRQLEIQLKKTDILEGDSRTFFAFGFAHREF